jgi:hypothetical protein
VEYAFDLLGETDQVAPAGYSLQQQEHATGTLTLRIMLAAKYVSSARLQYHGVYQSTLTSLGPSPEALKAALEKAQHEENVRTTSTMLFGVVGLLATKKPTIPDVPTPPPQQINTEGDYAMTVTAAPLANSDSLEKR